MSRPAPMDSIDRKLLMLIQEDGRAPYAELGHQVNLSVSAVNERLKKLQANTVLLGYTARLNPEPIGQSTLGFAHVILDNPDAMPGFIARVRAMPQIQECHKLTGEDGLFVKLRVSDLAQFEHYISTELRGLPGVREVRAMLALASYKETAALDCRSLF